MSLFPLFFRGKNLEKSQHALAPVSGLMRMASATSAKSTGALTLEKHDALSVASPRPRLGAKMRLAVALYLAAAFALPSAADREANCDASAALRCSAVAAVPSGVCVFDSRASSTSVRAEGHDSACARPSRALSR